ncbi:exostosin domain-containing protein [Marixanthomonas spongiae]|uniref:Exostosin GT47 domain-containing protein n=1 Tax=Marixanthomonas spongiae TaxID=2174845 RepID=A0A2U0I5T8_9FLAO|nr:exostosin family protein [Marixanthomonas spongiae]PVW16468.1 hypothetical protein DDV96_04220 [Marixanthomonas spongiae]
MKLYYPTSHYDPRFRREVFPLLKPFIKGKGFTDEARIKLYGVSETDFQLVETITEADVVVLPMAWNYYVKNRQLPKALECIEAAKASQKQVWSYNAGDFGVKIPEFDHVKVFRFSGYRANGQKGHCGMPVFITDYLTQHYEEEAFLKKHYSPKPVVGFCGQADDRVLTTGKELFRTLFYLMQSKLGLRAEEPQTVGSTSRLRAALLKTLERSDVIADNFIKRKQYRAGVTKNKAQHRTTKEFYDNILQSDYVLCVRGAGNFSVRFYETLMMGRIPVYIDTDGYLPLQDTIDWRNHVVWVDYNERHQVAQKVKAFHDALSAPDFIALQQSNRTLWKEKLTLGGFFKELVKQK